MSTLAVSTQHPASSHKTGAAIVALLLAVFVVPISVSGTAVTIPAIARDLGTQTIALQWVVNGFNVAFALSTLIWGGLSDRIGHKRTFVTGVLVMLVASAASALAPTLIALDVARAVAGIGAAAITTGASSVLSNAFTGDTRRRAFGALGTVLGLGIALGPAVSGALASTFQWRGVFAVFAAAFVVSLLLTLNVPSVPSSGERLPFFDMSHLRNAQFMTIALVPIVQAFGFITLLTYFPVILSALYGMGEGESGLFLLIMLVPVLLAPALAVRAVGAYRRVSMMSVVYVSIGAMLLGNVLLLTVTEVSPMWTLIAPMVLLGLSMGLPLGLIDGEALAAVPASRSGSAAGVLNFLRIGAEALAVAAYASVLAGLVSGVISEPALAAEVAAGSHAQPAAFTSAFHAAQLALIAVIVIGLVVIAVVHRAQRRR